MSVDRVILSWPTLLSAPASANGSGSPTSWMQIAKVGNFVSSRYGKFSITKADLATMLHNHANVTPKPPTQLPVDYDHLSMLPQKPLDGIAAGWIQKLELREDGNELWAEVRWTPEGAQRIKNQEYQFVSPSFVKDYVNKDGKKIGTTLLAAAITNHPFLDGMQALSLGAFAEHFAMRVPEAVSLVDVGQRVSIKEADELTPAERVQTFVIADVKGTGDDGFVYLKTEDGQAFGWFRATQLAPARKTADPTKEEIAMTTKDPSAELLTLTNTIAKERRIDFRSALLEAARQRPDLAEAHRENIADPELGDAATIAAPAPFTLSARAGESFDELAMRYANERGVSLRQAVHEVGKARPDLAAARG